MLPIKAGSHIWEDILYPINVVIKMGERKQIAVFDHQASFPPLIINPITIMYNTN